jgi:hypothetical protein
MKDARTYESYKEAIEEYYMLFGKCEFRRCFWCGQFFKIGRNSLGGRLSGSMYCSNACLKALRKQVNKMRREAQIEGESKFQNDWVLDMKTWEWTPKSV